MKVKINPRQLFMSGPGVIDLRKYCEVDMDDDKREYLVEWDDYEYSDISYILGEASIYVSLDRLPKFIEVETKDDSETCTWHATNEGDFVSVKIGCFEEDEMMMTGQMAENKEDWYKYCFLCGRPVEWEGVEL
ncbi:hypothetical protein [Aerococcus urinae]|uniref:hypothetical protein n=1 Tax=Aerococcus urinae TaxID=1376 RepID=UPI00254C9860|nr:hypothetical protein [Aerococcus urinae]MDK7716048.1 hypothetical protein [Aerococcus urinae]